MSPHRKTFHVEQILHPSTDLPIEQSRRRPEIGDGGRSGDTGAADDDDPPGRVQALDDLVQGGVVSGLVRRGEGDSDDYRRWQERKIVHSERVQLQYAHGGEWGSMYRMLETTTEEREKWLREHIERERCERVWQCVACGIWIDMIVGRVNYEYSPVLSPVPRVSVGCGPL